MNVEMIKKLRLTKQLLAKAWFGLRRFRIPIACVLALFIGLGVGYSYLGNQPFSDIWKWSTWKHLYDLLFSNT